jgi:phage protein D
VTDHYAPDYRLQLDGRQIPSDLRGAITSVSFTSGLEGSDRVEIGVANQYLRWTDDAALEPGVKLTLSLGYNPHDFEQVFVGEVVSVQASFPADGLPTLTIAAHDRFERLRESPKSRWFAVPVPFLKNGAIPDPAIAAMISAENGLIPIIDPVGAALAVILYGADVVVSVVDGTQIAVRRQEKESDLDFLQTIARENGWEMFIDHSDPLGGRRLRFMSPLDELEPVRTYSYGASLIDWSPRITTVGVIVSVTAFVRVSAIKTVFQVTVGYDWDRGSLDISIQPAVLGEMPVDPEETDEDAGKPNDRSLMIQENLSLVTAPRRILSELIPSLNGRVTGSGSVVGDPALIAGRVVQLERLGREFGGRYRITSATHTVDSSGYRTTFEGRKEIWFGSIPPLDQGAIALQAPFVDLEGAVGR